MHDIGEGVPKSGIETEKWYLKAAEQGNTRAQYNLGLMYAYGDGVTKNFVEAHTWVNVASGLGRTESKETLSLIEREMTSEQIAKATKLASERLDKFKK